MRPSAQFACMVRATFALLCLASAARADLFEYVARPEPAFEWTLRVKQQHPLGTVYDLHVVSQVWQDIRWEHQVQVYQPKDARPQATILLWNTGGSANERNAGFGFELARKIGAPVAFVYNIPNQPLLGNRKEDDLISETFLKYLSTQDETWPLLFPMVKSLVKSMDALQAFSKAEWQVELKQFVVSGASKRGWTSWLTAAADPRVKAIAPLVIDTLNMRKQAAHQKESFGEYSSEIDDYTRKGLVPIPETSEADRLWSMVDPWVYREKLKLPKMIINGNSDAYWTVDALNLYWDDLPGEKWITYVPNAGHGLAQKGADGKSDLSRAINSLAVFAKSQIFEKPLPKLTWKHHESDGQLQLTIHSDECAKSARIWAATAPSRDFRKSEWQPIEMQVLLLDNRESATATGEAPRPKTGQWLAFYGELEFDCDGLIHQLSTQIRVVQGK